MKRRRGFHEDFSRAEHVEGPTNRNVGLVFAAAGTIVGLWWFRQGRAGAAWWLAGALPFAAAAVRRPDWLAPLNRAWTRLGVILFHVVNPVVLGILYFVAITPIAYLMRITGHRPFRIRPEPCASYWVMRDPPGPAPDTIRNQF